VKEKEKKKEKGQVGLKRENVRMERLRGDFQTFELFISKPHINQKPYNEYECYIHIFLYLI
jgi:hypothetical protein